MLHQLSRRLLLFCDFCSVLIFHARTTLLVFLRTRKLVQSKTQHTAPSDACFTKFLFSTGVPHALNLEGELCVSHFIERLIATPCIRRVKRNKIKVYNKKLAPPVWTDPALPLPCCWQKFGAKMLVSNFVCLLKQCPPSHKGNIVLFPVLCHCEVPLSLPPPPSQRHAALRQSTPPRKFTEKVPSCEVCFGWFTQSKDVQRWEGAK